MKSTATVIYLNKSLHSEVKQAANQKFDKPSYVKSLWITREYKKRGGKVRYEGGKPSNESIKKAMADVRSANRTISFVSRMKGAEQGEKVKGPSGESCPSKRDISLKNWAFSP